MAINAYELCSTPTVISSFKVVRGPGSGRIMKPNLDDDWVKRGKTKKKKNSPTPSPYLHGEKIQLFSRMTEKRLVHKKNEVFSSYPMAANIYRASSDEFKALKKNRHKSRKSVLTLPNVPAPLPKACTVSDMNDSDYFNNKTDKKLNVPKRPLNQNNRKTRIKTKGYEFYDRDARHFECSSTDMFLKNGDGKTFSNGPRSNRDDVSVQDVWSVLRNINKFQFRPTPRISDEDSFTSKKKKNIFTRKFRSRKGKRLIETCRTEEVAYVANFEIQSKTSASQSSSFDRVTVISKGGLRNATKLGNAVAGTQNQRRIPYKPKKLVPLNDKILNKNSPRNDLRSTNAKNNQAGARNKNMNRMFGNATAVNEKCPGTPCTFKGSIDSSNCLRLTDNETSNCILKPNLTHPNDLEMVFNVYPRSRTNLPDKPLNTNPTEVPSNERMAIGMTQVVLNNNNNVNSALNKGLQKPKQRLVTTMPSAATMPKLTVSDIKRRIAQIKFPLVVLAKDQVSSSLEVFDYNPPQFDGLNKHIWPFMLEWKKKNTVPKRCPPKPAEGNASNLRKCNNEISLIKSRDRKIPNWDIPNKKKVDCRRGPQQEVVTPLVQKKVRPMRQLKDKMLKLLYKNTGNSQNTEPLEPIEIGPDKVDASTEMAVIEEDCRQLTILEEPNFFLSIDEQKKVPSPKKVAFVDTIPKKAQDIIVALDRPRNALEALNMKMPGAKHPWAKAKWASDFIDNVMRKIKNGSYYGIEANKALANYNVNITDKIVQNTEDKGFDTKEVSIQTFKILGVASKVDFEQNYSQSTHTLTEYNGIDPLVNIPGFDDSPPKLEIKTLNSNQIQVKNCVTNVMLQFDVTVPDKQSSHNVLEEKCSSSSSFIPLVTTNSKTKVFKCSTTILNAVLPAELCTVLPKLMQNIFDSTTTIASSTVLPNVTVSELSECESDITGSLSSNTSPVNNPWLNHYHPDAEQNQKITRRHKYWRYLPNNQLMGSQNPWTAYWVPPYGWPEYLPLYMSPELIKLLKGRFGPFPRKCERPTDLEINVLPKIKLEWSESIILPKLVTNTIIAFVDPMKPLRYDRPKPIENKSIENSMEVVKTSECTALELYKRKEASWIPLVGNLTSLLQRMWNYCKFNIHVSMPNYINSSAIICNRDCKNITVDMVVGDSYGIKKTMAVTITHVNTCYSNFGSCQCCEDRASAAVTSPIKCIEYPKELYTTKDVTNKMVAKKGKEKAKKRNNVKLFKKCKSASSIGGDRLCMPLNKIANMEDFTQALGAAKALCSVFDGGSGQKVLTCIEEMKLWIKDITPRQALLVLLLANKKETSNLNRFRPVLLQGIAVNRITRASELDMEIEVIERENVQLAQCEGIIYITASVENRDSLYDELCWIAKTTASDYQKPFDESSEKLLKSLIGKRKKLSPSYLRVMARYVGLGLLKATDKN